MPLSERDYMRPKTQLSEDHWWSEKGHRLGDTTKQQPTKPKTGRKLSETAYMSANWTPESRPVWPTPCGNLPEPAVAKPSGWWVVLGIALVMVAIASTTITVVGLVQTVTNGVGNNLAGIVGGLVFLALTTTALWYAAAEALDKRHS